MDALMVDRYACCMVGLLFPSPFTINSTTSRPLDMDAYHITLPRTVHGTAPPPVHSPQKLRECFYTISPQDRTREDFDAEVTRALEDAGVQLVLCVGYMRILSPCFCQRWAGRCLNVHPSLLPDFAGGMDLQVCRTFAAFLLLKWRVWGGGGCNFMSWDPHSRIGRLNHVLESPTFRNVRGMYVMIKYMKETYLCRVVNVVVFSCRRCLLTGDGLKLKQRHTCMYVCIYVCMYVYLLNCT